MHESDIHAGIGIVQQLLVFICAAGQALVDGHPIAREDRLVALRVLVVHPVLESGGEHDATRDGALQEPGAQERQQRQYGDRPGPVQNPLPKLAGPFVEAHIRIQFIFLVEVYRR